MSVNNTHQSIMARLYTPYILLDGNWSYEAYSKICADNGYKKDALVTTFTDRIGFLVAAIHNYPDMPVLDAVVSYSKQTMFEQHKASGGNVTNQQPTDFTIKPCCGGGVIR